MVYNVFDRAHRPTLRTYRPRKVISVASLRSRRNKRCVRDRDWPGGGVRGELHKRHEASESPIRPTYVLQGRTPTFILLAYRLARAYMDDYVFKRYPMYSVCIYMYVYIYIYAFIYTFRGVG